MKRIIVLLVISMFFTVLTACGDTQIDSPQSNGTSSVDDNGKLPISEVVSSQPNTLPFCEEVSSQPNTLEITSMGENKIVVSITDERALQVIDKTSSSQISVHFFNQDTNVMNFDLSIRNSGWIACSGVGSDYTDPDAYVSGQSDTFSVAGNKVSFEVVQIGIGKKISESDYYVVVYLGADAAAGETFAEGLLTDVLTLEESDAKVKLVYYNDNEVLIHLSGEMFQEYLKSSENGTLWVGFYPEGSSEHEPQYRIQFPFGEYDGRKYVQASLMNLSSEGWGFLQGDTNPDAVITSNGCSGKIHYKDIKTLLSACDRIVIEDQNRNVITKESYQNAIILEEYTIPPIPEVFPVNDRDKDFFYPVTDDYMVIMIDMPLNPIYNYEYGFTDQGETLFRYGDTHESPLKMVVILSYDEFGIFNQKTKIIYDSVSDTMKAPAHMRMEVLFPAELTGDEAADNEIINNFYKALDQTVFGSSREGDLSYQYFGHFDNVRYFASRTQKLPDYYNYSYLLSYDRNSSFDEDGFIVETSNYSYEFPVFSGGYGSTEIRENTATTTVFYSGKIK